MIYMNCNAAFMILENKVTLWSFASRLNSVAGRMIDEAMADKMTPKPLAKLYQIML